MLLQLVASILLNDLRCRFDFAIIESEELLGVNCMQRALIQTWCASILAELDFGGTVNAMEEAMNSLLLADASDFDSDAQRLRAAFNRLSDLLSLVYSAKPTKHACKALLSFLCTEDAKREMHRQFPSKIDVWDAKLKRLMSYIDHWQGFEGHEDLKLHQLLDCLR